MHRCHISPAAWSDQPITLTPEEGRHLAESMRARAGDRVAVFDGQGRVGEAEVLTSGGGRRGVVTLRRFSEQQVERPAVAMTLMQAIPKGRRMDEIVDRATELGVVRILPVITDRTIVRDSGDERMDVKVERWRRVVLSAAKQCGVAWLPEVAPPLSYPESLSRLEQDELLLIGSLEANASPFRMAMAQLRSLRPKRVSLLIGPEGDFTAAEISAAVATGAIPVGFGKRVLRSDMAATYGLAVLAYELLGE